MKVKIHVTQDHIDNGQMNKACFCPIALALKTQHVYGAPFVINKGVKACDEGGFIPLPRSACRFIKAFDNGREVKPFNFLLDFDAPKFNF